MAVAVSTATDWTTQCAENYKNACDLITGLVDQFGQLTNNRTKAWGITVEACFKYCGPDQLIQVLFTEAYPVTEYLEGCISLP